MPTNAIAAVVHEKSGGFSLEKVELDDPRPDELLIRIEASGVCHTDSLAKNLVELPAVFGHEGTGIVEKVGSAVTDISVGQRVVISFPYCGSCPKCTSGKRYWCNDAYPLLFGGARADGSKTIALNGQQISSAFFQQSSFASHAVTVARNVVPIPDRSVAANKLAALPCAVVAGSGSVLNEMRLAPGDSLVVFGAGGVGLSAVMAAHVAGAFSIAVVDVVDARLELAKELGATHTINAKNSDVLDGLREIAPSGFDYVLETSGNVQSFHNALIAVTTGGTMAAVTVPNYGGTFEFNGEMLIGKGIHLVGVRMGSARAIDFIPKLIDLHQRGLFPFDKLLTQYRFEDINTAFSDVAEGKAIKPILNMV